MKNKPAALISMARISLVHQITVWFITFMLAMPVIAEKAKPDKIPTTEENVPNIQEVRREAQGMDDPLIRQSLVDLLASAEFHVPLKNSSEAGSKKAELMNIYWSSQRVRSFFAGYKREYTQETVQNTRVSIARVYAIVFNRISWAKNSGVAGLSKIHEQIQHNYTAIECPNDAMSR